MLTNSDSNFLLGSLLLRETVVQLGTPEKSRGEGAVMGLENSDATPTNTNAVWKLRRGKWEGGVSTVRAALALLLVCLRTDAMKTYCMGLNLS